MKLKSEESWKNKRYEITLSLADWHTLSVLGDGNVYVPSRQADLFLRERRMLYIRSYATGERLCINIVKTDVERLLKGKEVALRLSLQGKLLSLVLKVDFKKIDKKTDGSIFDQVRSLVQDSSHVVTLSQGVTMVLLDKWNPRLRIDLSDYDVIQANWILISLGLAGKEQLHVLTLKGKECCLGIFGPQVNLF